MIMCPKLCSSLFLVWIATLSVDCQIQTYPGLNECGTSCQQNGPINGNYYAIPWYPQYSQIPFQYPTYNQFYQQYPQYMPYVSTSNQPQQVGYQQLYTNQPSSVSTVKSEVNAPKTNYDGIKTEVIDIEPKYFRYLYSNLLSKPVYQPQTNTISVRKNAPYVVKIDSNQYNNTNVPQVIKKHDVQHKTYTFKKTFVLTPGDKDSVINMNFVNGVPVTTDATEELQEEARVQEETNESLHQETTTTEQPITTTEEPITTTENDDPVSINSWFR